MWSNVCHPPSIDNSCTSVHQLVILFLFHVFTLGIIQKAALRMGLYTGSLISVIFFPRLLKAHEDFASHSPATSVVLMCAFEDS